MKNVLLDSSSLILLFHTGLIEKLAGHFSLYITREVELEITKKVKPGAARFQDHIHQGVLNVLHAPQIRLQNKRLGIGEASILSAWNSGSADFVILDDRQAILHAKENDIPFINALLVPKILFCKKILQENHSLSATQMLQEKGYYSHSILQKAHQLTCDDLRTFLP